MRIITKIVVLGSVVALGLIGSGVANAATGVVQSPAYTSSSSDGGTCGNQWAVDLYNRVFSQPTADPAGNYAIVEKFTQGHFSTTAGVSPGACDTGTNNGNTVREGLSGSFSGSEHLFITDTTSSFTVGNGTCNGYVSSDAAHPCTTSSYIAYHYPGATATTVTSYVFTYKTGAADALGTKTWKEVSTNGTSETDTGDIYTTAGP